MLFFPLLGRPHSPTECQKKITQAEKSECMELIKDEAIGDLVTHITVYCSEKKEIKESEGGTLYPMLLNQCLEKEFKHLDKIFNELKD